MLTNNKKSCFVKVVSLILATLMVLVCFAGCTDADAQKLAEDAKKAADAAQVAADAAKAEADKKTTADAVATQISNALKDYLKTADQKDVDAIVKKAIDDLKINEYAKASDITNALADYAKSSQVSELSGKLAALAAKNDVYTKAETEAKISEKITAALANYSVTAQVEEALKGKVLSAADVTKIVNDTLAGFYTNAQIDDKLNLKADKTALEELVTKVNGLVTGSGNYVTAGDLQAALADYVKTTELDAKLAEYFGADTEPATVLAAMKDYIKASQYKELTPKVLEAIKNIQDLRAVLAGIDYTNIYLTANKKVMEGYMNTLLGNLTVFSAEYKVYGGPQYNDAVAAAMKKQANTISYEEAMKIVEFRFLRAATAAELDELNTAITNCTKVVTFAQEFAAQMAKINALGQQVEAYLTSDADKKTAKDYQFVTIQDKAAFDTFIAELDALFVKYVTNAGDTESAFAKATTAGVKIVYECDTCEKVNVLDSPYYVANMNNMFIVTAYQLKTDPKTVVYAEKNPDATKYNALNYKTVAVKAKAAIINKVQTYTVYVPAKEDPNYDVRAIYYIPATVLGADDNDVMVAQPDYFQAVTIADRAYNTSGAAMYTLDFDGETRVIEDGIWTAHKINEGKADPVKNVNSYWAVIAMLQDCQKYIKEATDMIRAFCAQLEARFTADDKKKVVKPDTYTKYLTEELCEPEDQIEIDDADTIFLSKGKKTLNWEDEELAARVVEGAVKKAYVINAFIKDLNTAADNDCVSIKDIDTKYYLTDYELYIALVERAYDILFAKYKRLATEEIHRIYNDYRSVLAYAQQLSVYKNEWDLSAAETKAAILIQLNLANEDYITSDSNGLVFLKAFINGESNIERDFSKKNVNSQYKTSQFNLNTITKYNAYKDVEAIKDNIVEVDPFKTLSDNRGVMEICLQASYIKPIQQIKDLTVDGLMKDAFAKYPDNYRAIEQLREAFGEMIDNATANFNEVFARYLLEDFKQAYLNRAVSEIVENAVVALGIANAIDMKYGSDTVGLLTFFGEGLYDGTGRAVAADNDQLKAAMLAVVTKNFTDALKAYQSAAGTYIQDLNAGIKAWDMDKFEQIRDKEIVKYEFMMCEAAIAAKLETYTSAKVAPTFEGYLNRAVFLQEVARKAYYMSSTDSHRFTTLNYADSLAANLIAGMKIKMEAYAKGEAVVGDGKWMSMLQDVLQLVVDKNDYRAVLRNVTFTVGEDGYVTVKSDIKVNTMAAARDVAFANAKVTEKEGVGAVAEMVKDPSLDVNADKIACNDYVGGDFVQFLYDIVTTSNVDATFSNILNYFKGKNAAYPYY